MRNRGSSQDPDAAPESTPLRNLLRPIGTIAKGFGSNEENVDVHMAAIDEALGERFLALQARQLNRRQLLQELCRAAMDQAGNFDDFCALYLLLSIDPKPTAGGTMSASGPMHRALSMPADADADNMAPSRMIDSALQRDLAILLDPKEPQHSRDYLLQGLCEAKTRQALPVVQKLHWLSLLMVAQDFFVLFGENRFLAARATLGDRSIAREVIIACYAKKAPSEYQELRQALDDLIAQQGNIAHLLPLLNPQVSASKADVQLVEEQLKALAQHDPDSEVCCWALDTLVKLLPAGDTAIFVECLGDERWLVAAQANRIIVKFTAPPIERLKNIANDISCTPSHRLWSAYTLLQLGFDIAGSIANIAELRVPIPAIIPQIVREAIVRHWTTSFGANEDVRWLLEELQLPAAKPYAFAEMLAQLIDHLRANGMIVGDYIDYAAYMRQGSASFGLLPVNDDQLYISKIGPFVAFAAIVRPIDQDGASDESTHLSDIAAIDPDGEKQRLAAICKRAATVAGYHWLDEDLLGVTMPGFASYYGQSTIRYLVFHWSD